MPNDDFSPDFTKLDGDYQVLTELHGEGDSRTYLARHLRLNRDVTISVFRAAEGADTLAEFASDARLLTAARHPHVVPVIDGRWLDDETFATVHARVRGATLDQALGASGPMSIARVASTIRDIAEALAWARETGVAQRSVVPWGMIFQQGSGRVLLSFDAVKTSGHAMGTACDDAQTLRRLAIEMLAGESDRSKLAEDVVVPRGIPSDVADALAAIRHCTVRNAEGSVNALLTALDAAAAKSRDERTQIPPTLAPPGASVTVANPTSVVPERVVPTVVEPDADVASGPIRVVTSVPRRRRDLPSQRDDAVVVVKPAFGFNARLGTAIAVVGVVAALGVVLLNRKDASTPTVATVTPQDSGSSSAGEVALHPPARAPTPPKAVSRREVPPPVDSTRTVRRAPLTAEGSPPRDSSASARKKASVGDSTTRPKTPAVLDSAAEAERRFQRDSAADVSDPCLSSEQSSQRRCLTAAIQKNDRELNAVYARLIAALRRQAGAASADPDPDTVNDLRAGQQKWADSRDAACRDIGDEPLFAKSRGACYAQQATNRARELQRMLDAIPPAT